MTFDAQFMLQVMIALASGGGVYAAIRADLATLHEKTANASETAKSAHRRIDDMLQNTH
jgi:hypothetical protein